MKRPIVLQRLFVISLVLGITACSDDETVDDNPVLGCDRASQHQCIDFGTAYSQQEASANCDGSVLQGPCTTNNTVGSCQIQDGFVFTHYYFATGWNAMTAEADCTDRDGTFSP